MKMTNDLRSSVVVFLVALPLCLGIALASHAPLSSGILAGIIGGIVVGFLSGSDISVSGPAAGLTVIVATAISQLGSFEALCLSVALAGLMQFLFGILRAGDLGQFFPSPVIRGMLAAIGLILIMKQAPMMVGWHSGAAHQGVAIIGFVSLCILLLWEKVLQPRFKVANLVPGALIAVLAGISLQVAFRGTPYEVDSSFLVALPYDGSWSGFWSTLHLPDLHGLSNYLVWKTAITLAIVASLETLLSLDAADRMDPLKRVSNKNRELLAQGIGNLASGMVGGLPVTAVIVRTTANVSAGGTHRTSAVAHGMWLLLCAMLIPDLLNYIPLSTLATVLVLVGYKLCKPAVFKEISRQGQVALMLFVTTILAILLTDLLVGIFIGMVMGISFTFKKFQRNVVKVETRDGLTVLRFHHHVTFLHKAYLMKVLSQVPEGQQVTIESAPGLEIHHDIHDLLKDYGEKAAGRNIQVRLLLS